MTNEPSDSHLTSRIGTTDLSYQAPARPVVPLSAAADGGEANVRADTEGAEHAACEAAGETSTGTDCGPPAEEAAERVEARPAADERRRLRKRALRATEEAQYRSVRVLARAVIVSNVSMMIAVVSLAAVFSYSLRQSQDNLIALSKENAAAHHENVAVIEKFVNKGAADRAELRTDLEKALKEAIAKSTAETTEAVKQAVWDQFIQLRGLPAVLETAEHRALRKGAATVLRHANLKDKPTLEAFNREASNNRDRRLLLKDATTVLTNLAPQTKEEFQKEVMAPLLGE